jgi:hypothetical protein
MNIVLTQNFESLPEPIGLSEITKPEGILNSNYQQIVRSNYNTTATHSLFGIRRRIKRRRYQMTPSIDTILKLSVFVIVLVAIF